MCTKEVEVKQLVGKFREDGSVYCEYDEGILDEPFMGILYNTLNNLADTWFYFVLGTIKTKVKTKEFEIIVKI